MAQMGTYQCSLGRDISQQSSEPYEILCGGMLEYPTLSSIILKTSAPWFIQELAK